MLLDNLHAISSMAQDPDSSSGGFSEAQAKSLLPQILSQVDQSTWTSLTEGTTTVPANLDAAQIFDWSKASASDLEQIATNFSGDPSLQQAVMNQFNNIRFSVEAEARAGTLIRGFGLGFYNNNYVLYSLGTHSGHYPGCGVQRHHRFGDSRRQNGPQYPSHS